jgi:hypothetical protein
MDTPTNTIQQQRRPIEPEAISPALFAHFVLRTSNFEAMRRWYKTVLNAGTVRPAPAAVNPDARCACNRRSA